MPLTVADLVGQPLLGLTVRAGAAGCGAQVRWAHASELLDPSPWLRGGELLLTTGMALPEDAAGVQAYLHRLADAGVAGVAFGVGVQRAAVPQALVAVADERSLPLLEVPLPVPFIAITEAVAAHHAAEQQETTQRLVEVLRAMTRAALRQGPAGVLRVLIGSLGGSAAALDEYGAVLAEAGPTAGGLLADGRAELSRRPASGTPFSAMVTGDGGRLVLQSIGGSRSRGYLLLRTDRDWSSYAQLVLAQANSLLSITVDKPDAVLRAERRLRAEVLTSILDGTRPAELAGQLSAFGFADGAGVVAVALQTAGAAAELAETASRALERRPWAHLVAVREGRVLVLLAAGESDAGELVVEVLAAVPPADRIHVGMSAPAAADDALDAVIQAELAVRAARAERRPLCRFGELSTYTLLLASQSREALAQVAGSALEPLLEHDRRRGAQLLETLEVFLAHNAQAVPAAAALGVHRHTLRNRIRKVTELTGRNLDSPHDRTELWLALKARELARLGPTHPEP
jgi:PucR family transcriptional regulator, purine catabolism regulatory protein